MNPRTTWTLVALAAGLFAFIFFVEPRLATVSTPAGPQRILPHLRREAVTSIQVRPAGQLEIRAERTNGNWRLTRPVHYPANAAGIEALLQALDKLVRHTHITARELRNRPQADREFGFDTPQAALIIQQAAHRSQLLIGSKTAFGDEVFVQVVGTEGVCLADADWLKWLPRHADAWRDTTLANWKGLTFDRLAVTNGPKAFELRRDATHRLWRLAHPMDARADNPRVQTLLAQLQNLRVTQFVTDDPKPQLEHFGLQPPALELAFAQGTNTALLLQFGKSATNDPSQVFVRRQGQSTIALVPAEPLQPWRGDFRDFQDRHLVTMPALRAVEAVEVRGAENFTLQRQTNGTWRVTAPEELPADELLVREFLAGLSGLRVAQFVKDVVTEPDFPNYGLAPPARQITLRSATNVIVQLHFGAVEGDRLFVRRSDEHSVYAVRLEDFRQLPAAGWQLRDRRIWSYAASEVTKLTIRQQGKVRELVRAGTNSWAFAPGSQGIINDFAVEETVHRLGELTAAAWVDRGDQNRSRYGFTENPHQISLEVRRGDKTQMFSVEFGGSAPSRFPCAAVSLEGQVWIFEFPLVLYQFVQSYLTIPPGTP